MGLNPGQGRSPGGGNVNPLQCSCLENPMESGSWRATVMGLQGVRHDLVTKQQQQQHKVCLDFFLFPACPIFPLVYVEKTIFTLLCFFSFFEKDQLTTFMQVYLGAPGRVSQNTVFSKFFFFLNLDNSTLFSLKGLGKASPAGSFFLLSSVPWNRTVSIL